MALVVKKLPANAGVIRDVHLIPGSGISPWRSVWRHAPVFLPGESHGQRTLLSYSPWDCKRVGHDLVTKQQGALRAFVYSSNWKQGEEVRLGLGHGGDLGLVLLNRAVPGAGSSLRKECA